MIKLNMIKMKEMFDIWNFTINYCLSAMSEGTKEAREIFCVAQCAVSVY